MDVHARTSGYFNSFYDPYMNILRSTTATFSAILGGVDSLHSGTFDEAFSVPDEFSRRIARNIQLILLNESHVNQPVDPAGGSYYLEALTSQVAEKSWLIFQKLMQSGGMLESLIKEIPQSMIDRLNRQRRDDFVRLKTVLVGINGYADPNDGKAFFDPYQPVDFKKFSESRDEKSNDDLDCLSFKTPIRDLIREGMLAFESGAALGDVSAALNKLETPSSEIVRIKMFRLAEVFEDLRKRLQVLTKNIGFKPKVFQIQIGQIVDYKSQAAFSKGIFQLPGFEVVTQSAEAVITEINNTVNKSDAAIVVICTGRIELSEEIENIISEVKKIVPDGVIFVSGYPPEDEKRFTQMGVNAFIYRGMDVHKILDQVISRLEEK
jgi:methylmalonyl-CoA mutase